ncbi:YnaM/YnfT family protein [Mangrovibacter phragmitis]
MTLMLVAGTLAAILLTIVGVIQLWIGVSNNPDKF